jgi:hypothetical protein
MRIFKYIMNSMGKKFFYFLFLLSALFVCRACAMYFLGIEKNFQCPICNLLKGASTNEKTVFVLCADPSTTVSSTDENISLPTKSIQPKKSGCNCNNCFFATDNIEFVCSPTPEPRVLNLASNKLYLLFKRLKIGDRFLFC